MLTTPPTPDLRSYQGELARRRPLFAQLSEQELLDFERWARPRLPTVMAKWRYGIEPMPFDEFCWRLDGRPLWPEQYDAWELPNTLRANNLFSDSRVITEWVLSWGKGSLAAGTPLRDEETGTVRTAEEWCESGEAITVRSLVGTQVVPMQATPVFCKGIAQTYRVELEDGRGVAVSANHKFLTPNGWRMAKELVVCEDCVWSVPDWHGGLYDRTHLSIPDSQGDCHRAGYSGDEHSPVSRGCAQDDAPSQSDEHSDRPCLREEDNDKSHYDSVPAGYSLAEVSRNCADAYQPLVRSSDDDEESLLECHISPQVHAALDHFCSLPLPEKRSLLSDFADLDAMPHGPERVSGERAFGERLYSSLRRAWLQSEGCLENGQDHEAGQDQSGAWQWSSGNYVRVVAVVPYNYTRIYDLTVPVAQNYLDTQGILHHNSGKDYLAAKLIAYVAYCVLRLAGDPAEFFDLAPGTRLDVVNVAPNGDLARRIFFEYLCRFLQTPLFAGSGAIIGADTVEFPSVNLFLLSRHSRSAGLDGFNLLCWIMDEADAFLDTQLRSNAEDIHRIFRSSAETRFPGRWIGIVISYPRTKIGFLVKLLKRAQNECRLKGKLATFYWEIKSTFKVNPRVKRSDPGVQSDYDNDPAGAAAMYECIPREGEQVFFEFPEKIDQAVEPDRQPCAVLREHLTNATLRDGSVMEYVGALVERIDRRGGATYFLSGDGGLSGDEFALCVMHIDESSDAAPWLCRTCSQIPQVLHAANYRQLTHDEGVRLDMEVRCGICGRYPFEIDPLYGKRGWWQKQSGETREVTINGRPFHLPHLYEDLIYSFKPHRAGQQGHEANRPVDFACVQEVVRQIAVALNVVRMRFDPWNTAQMVQGLLASTGIDTDTISFSNPEQLKRGLVSKALLHRNMLTLLPDPDEGVDRISRDDQWKQLQRIGGKLDHPQGGKKDKYDVEAICIWQAATYADKSLEIVFGGSV